jgi:hypothetical protein
MYERKTGKAPERALVVLDTFSKINKLFMDDFITEKIEAECNMKN